MRESLFLVLWVFWQRIVCLLHTQTHLFTSVTLSFIVWITERSVITYNHTLVSQGFSTQILFHKFSEASYRSQHCRHCHWHRPKDRFFFSFLIYIPTNEKISIYIYTNVLALHSWLGVCSNPTASWWISLKRFSTRVTYVINYWIIQGL